MTIFDPRDFDPDLRDASYCPKSRDRRHQFQLTFDGGEFCTFCKSVKEDQMKIAVPMMVEKTIATIRVSVPVRYDEDDMPNDYPHRKGDSWHVDINAADGQIRGWPQGVEPRRIEMKVVDGGSYTVLDENGETIIEISDDYVPGWIPGEYGDYIDFNIDESGRITNWKDQSTLATGVMREVEDRLP